jgi:hypothetical protein
MSEYNFMKMISTGFFSVSTLGQLFVECCRDIEELSFESDDVILRRSDIKEIDSLPRLKSLNITCSITSEALFYLDLED